MVQVADALQLIAQHARAVNTDLQLRRRLVAQQTADRVQEERQLLDPPLLRQETDASHAYLSMLLHVASSSEPSSSRQADGNSSLHWSGAVAAQQAIKVRRWAAAHHWPVMVALCSATASMGQATQAPFG
jgi:anti-sigma-K factor RskA